MIMSFANPLGVGLTSDGEYMDIEIHISYFLQRSRADSLNDTMVEGIQVLSFRQMPDEKGRQSHVSGGCSGLRGTFPERLCTGRAGRKRLDGLLAKKIPSQLVKKTKKREEEIDIRPLIYELHLRRMTRAFPDSFLPEVPAISKPELVMEAFAALRRF